MTHHDSSQTIESEQQKSGELLSACADTGRSGHAPSPASASARSKTDDSSAGVDDVTTGRAVTSDLSETMQDSDGEIVPSEHSLEKNSQAADDDVAVVAASAVAASTGPYTPQPATVPRPTYAEAAVNAVPLHASTPLMAGGKEPRPTASSISPPSQAQGQVRKRDLKNVTFKGQ